MKGQWKQHDAMQIQPQQTVRMELDVFCIDSHRASPTSKTQFSIASERLPPKLRSKIEKGTRALMKSKRASRAIGARRAVQSHIWNTRDADWEVLQGERANEKASKGRSRPREIDRRVPRRTPPTPTTQSSPNRLTPLPDCLNPTRI